MYIEKNPDIISPRYKKKKSQSLGTLLYCSVPKGSKWYKIPPLHFTGLTFLMLFILLIAQMKK